MSEGGRATEARRTTTGPGEPGPLRRWVSKTLTVGVLSAVALVAAGMAWAIVSGQPLDPTGAPLIDELMAAEPRSLVLLGILVLVLTPVAQLLAAMAAFARNGERRYVAITLIVLAILLLSLGLAALAGDAAEARLMLT